MCRYSKSKRFEIVYLKGIISHETRLQNTLNQNCEIYAWQKFHNKSNTKQKLFILNRDLVLWGALLYLLHTYRNADNCALLKFNFL